MTIFYTVSYFGKSTYQKYYDYVLDALQKQKVTIISPELGNYLNYLTARQKKQAKTPEARHYLGIKSGIQKADAVVIDVTHQDFQIGWEAALACTNKKPLLCLSLHQDFTGTIQHPYFHAAKYTDMTVDNIIEDFIRKTKPGLFSNRFNFFLSTKQLQSLKRSAKANNQSTSDYLRTLIDQAEH
jgi:hypothetical protein